MCVCILLAASMLTACGGSNVEGTTTASTTLSSTTPDSTTTPTSTSVGTDSTSASTTVPDGTAAEITTPSSQNTTGQATSGTEAQTTAKTEVTTKKTTAKTTEKTTAKTTEKTTATTEEIITMPVSEKTYEANDTNVKTIGRTYYDGDILWLALSASGIEFTFAGSKAEITVIGDNTYGTDGTRARFAVYVNGERTMDEMVTAAEKTYTVFSSAKAKTTTVKIVKLSEAAQSTLGIKEIKATATADGIKPTADKKYLIEFIGDSITCGYGVDDPDKTHSFSTATEDATKAYAVQTAETLGVDYSLVSYSGYGIISGYTTGTNKQTSQLVPKEYEKTAFSYGNYNGFNIGSIPWEFKSSDQPDIVVINLGTNDQSYTKSELEKFYEFIAGYKDFIAQVRAKNPKAYILCTYGIMDTTLTACVSTAVEEYSADTNDSKISYFEFGTREGKREGYAADWHPTLATQTRCASELVAEIQRLKLVK